MGTGNSFENLGIGKLPFLIGRVPGAARQWLIDVTIAVEQFKKLPDADLPPLREVILSRKSSRPALLVRARLNMSGNSALPFLIWDKLT